MKINYLLIVFLMMLLSIMSNGQSIDSLLDQAYRNNPEIKALQNEYEATLQKESQVSQLPDPNLSVAVPVLPIETRLGAQKLYVSVSQMFPWFGTLNAKKEVVLAMAKSKYERIAAARLDIDYQIKTAYLNLYLIREKQKVIKRNIRIFETIEKIALAKVESGKTIITDVLTVQLQIEELKKQIQILNEQKEAYYAIINEVRGATIDEAIEVDTTHFKLADIGYDLGEYKQKIQSNHPKIRQINFNIETSNKEVELNDLNGTPTFGLGLDYGFVSKRTDMNPIDNGRDILIPKVFMTLPIYRNKYSAKRKEEKLKQQAYEFQKENLTNKMVSNVQQYKSEYESAKIKFELAIKQIEICNSAYDILLEDYSSKGKHFDELMRLQSDINKYEIEKIIAIVQSHLAKYKIERITDF